jgi:hypothetical protein
MPPIWIPPGYVMPPIMVDGKPTPPITIPPEGGWVMPPMAPGGQPTHPMDPGGQPTHPIAGPPQPSPKG